jgi:electron transport complex protein RnfC
MLKKSFIGITTPRLEYESLTGTIPDPILIPPPSTVRLLVEGPFEKRDASLFAEGDAVTTGQPLRHSEQTDAYAVATVDGTVGTISAYIGDFGKAFTAVTLQRSEEKTEETGLEVATPFSLDSALAHLMHLPGTPPLKTFTDETKPIHTIVIYGGDNDILVSTNQYVVKTRAHALEKGIAALKQITGVDRVVLAVPGEAVQTYGHLGAEVKNLSMTYPSAFPQMILPTVFGQTLPAGKSCEDLGFCFMTAEAVASIGEVHEKGQYPARKLITVINKAEKQQLVSAVIGTPLSDIFQQLGITVQDGDRIIVGGPMTGSAVYLEDYPVMPDTSAIVIQDKDAIPFVSDYPCINCGDCVRICPVCVPINMLVRFLEAGYYEEAADQYDLYSCIGCGLCSFTCPSKIPIYQFIRLAKYELERMKSAEAANEPS